MEQKDIDKLLVGRKIIEDHRTRKMSIKSKASLGTISTAQKESQIDTSKETYLEELCNLGFESFDDFHNFNYRMNLEAFKEGWPIEGECDKCRGLEKANCFEEYGDQSCYSTDYTTVTDIQYSYAMGQYLIGNYGEVSKNRVTPLTKKGLALCPEGRGFYTPANKIKLPFKIDITWM